MKVCIKYNQVEIALQALHGSGEKVVFGTTSLKNKYKLYYIVTSVDQFRLLFSSII